MLKELLTTYWSQVTLLLLGIAFFIKRLFDNKSKKVEINHSLFQQNKIDTVNNYFKNYARVELMWRQIQTWKIFSREVSTVEMDNIIWPPLNDLKQSILELKLYFDDDIHTHFNEILENFLSINSELMDIHFGDNEGLNAIKKSNRFSVFKDKAIRRNGEILGIISKKFRQSFK